jgi:predicted nucleic-acid-binding Zn-ribbon protein
MRNTSTCPKCSGRDILRIDGRIGAHGAGNNIAIGWMSSIFVTRYMCVACGYSEEWIDHEADRAKLVEKFRV